MPPLPLGRRERSALRILLVNAHGDPSTGGAEKHVGELAGGLAGRGHEVDLLQAFPDAGPPAFPGNRTVLHSSDWRTSELRRLRNHLDDALSLPLRRVRDLIAERTPDVVHTHNLPGLGTGVWETCRRLGVPLVHTLHDYYLLCPRVTLTRRDGAPCRPSPLVCGLRARRLGRFGGAVGDVVGVSRHVLDRHAHVFPRARGHVIRNPVIPGSDLASRPPGTHLRTIGYLGSLDRIKGVHVLLQAAPELVRRGCSVVLAGAGRLEPDVQAAVARGEVRFLGPLSGPAKSAFFDTCDLGVVPSVWEEPGGPTYTMVEWLSSGRPLLVSRRGGLAEALDSLPGAIAVDPTPQALVMAIERLLEPPAWRDAVSRIRPVEAPGGFGRWVDEYEAVYRSAVASGENTA
jgi:glycosyltransferase involved in cell wall biosynthesis